MDGTTALNVVLAAASVIGAGVAIWQAIDARNSKREAEAAVAAAERAATASERQAAAAERAVQLQEEQAQPEPWTAAPITGDTYSCTNSSGKTIIVREITWKPENSHMIIAHRAANDRYESGDRFEFAFSRRLPSRPHALVVRWSWEGQEDYRTLNIGRDCCTDR